ncbi:glycosyl transferase family 2 [Microbulbifer agarilyticus]|uniref:Glycosyl transferase family 2 n=1 Tax=Microbulbifer agarilyticus TaxID=260552 RepID=A0A1Q2M2Q5_9GAMM|nr:glycosyltransferase family 2 protein [Microbulbifer agarilyticus]AQQ66946.1 glycosyl transferase family 2 [Microbulbifer agarilyticus]
MIKSIGSYFFPDLCSELVAGANVQPVTGDEVLDWESTSDDPQFSLGGVSLSGGWYMLELQLVHAAPSADARLYFDFGEGFSEEDSVFLPVKCNRVTKRLVYLPKRAKSIRFDPMESKGGFGVKHFRLVKLLTAFAMDRLIQRLVNMHDAFRDVSKTEAKRRVKLEAKSVGKPFLALALKYYNQTFERRRQTVDYQHWIDNQEASLFANARKAACGEEDWSPLVSVVVPTYNAKVRFLEECIDSVLAQSYQNWELCIADDCSTNPEVKECLSRYVEKDSRIKVAFREVNGHISSASNSALELVSGEFVALLDHDDVLSEEALSCVVGVLQENRNLKLIYSDEDKIDESGMRFEPHFKPDWNPDLLLSQNYICHLTVLARELVADVGGFRVGFEGSQDHDLLLRCVPHLDVSTVARIPLVLYHWRAMSGSTALEAQSKSYTSEAGVNAIQSYLDLNRIGGKVEFGKVPNTYRIRREIPEEEPLVSLLVPTRDGVDILKPCVNAILERTSYENFELLILDNQTTCAATLEYLADVVKDPRVSVHRWNHPFNYSAINNYGAELANGSIIGLINNDIEPINNDWLTEMVSQVVRPEIGCVGAKLYYPDDSIQHAGVILGIGGVAGHSHKYFNRHDFGYFSRLHLVQGLSAVTAACLLVRKPVFDAVNGLDEENLSVSFNDVDFCLKVREAGYQNLWTPYAELYHHESVSRGADDTIAKRQRAAAEARFMRDKWGHTLDQDPAYSPNLTLVHEDFSLA